jgi:hypothetical protein
MQAKYARQLSATGRTIGSSGRAQNTMPPRRRHFDKPAPEIDVASKRAIKI